MNRIVTLTTDFGQGDYDVGVLRGVIWSIAPQARLADLSHEIGRHDVLEAALMLERCTPYFPANTIHVVVVDPGVGTERRAIAARLGEQWFVGPDNGLITRMRARAISLDAPIEIVHLNQPRFWLSQVSAIFHGRDIFASVAGHLAAGIPLAEVGEAIDDPVLLTIPEPEPIQNGWRGDVMHIDAFGNLSTNLDRRSAGFMRLIQPHLNEAAKITVCVRSAEIHGLIRTFGDGKPGDLAALFDSSGKLCVCMVNGNAAEYLGAAVGDYVEVRVG